MIRALATFVLAFVALLLLAAVFGGFGVGSVELAIIVLLSLAVAAAVLWLQRGRARPT